MRLRFVSLPLCFIAVIVFASAQGAAQTVTPPKISGKTQLVEPPAPLLPSAFDGWVASGKPAESKKTTDADSANAAALTEYGLTRYAGQTYTRTGVNGTPDTLIVKAFQFPDATGTFGAFTFYRRPNMASEDLGSSFPGSKDLGTGGASGPIAFDPTTNYERILFWDGTILVDARYSHVDAMTASEMRDLAKLLPAATNSHALIPPPLPRYLPVTGLQPMSVRYALGNSSYQSTGGVLPLPIAGFDREAEAVTANYNFAGADGTLTLVEYPTPQMAIEQQNALNAVTKSAPGFAASAPGAVQVRRSGPLLAVTSGNFNQKQAQQLLGAVHYDADIIWNNTQGYVPETKKAANLLVGVILISAVLCLISLALGIALGGGRAVVRVLRGKNASAMDETFEFTKLNLSGEPAKGEGVPKPGQN